jgi:hypothetical protein
MVIFLQVEQSATVAQILMSALSNAMEGVDGFQYPLCASVHSVWSFHPLSTVVNIKEKVCYRGGGVMVVRSLILREIHSIKVFPNSMLSRMFGPNTEEVKMRGRLHDE